LVTKNGFMRTGLGGTDGKVILREVDCGGFLLWVPFDGQISARPTLCALCVSALLVELLLAVQVISISL